MLYSKDCSSKMKKYIIFGVALILVMVILVVATKIDMNNKKIDVTSFELIYSNGYSANANGRYIYKNNTIIYKKSGYSENKLRTTYVDNTFKEKLEKIIKEYDVLSWDGFNSSDDLALDGDSFTLTVVNNGKTIKAHGYMRYPKYYSIFENRIIDLFYEYKF